MKLKKKANFNIYSICYVIVVVLINIKVMIKHLKQKDYSVTFDNTN